MKESRAQSCFICNSELPCDSRDQEVMNDKQNIDVKTKLRTLIVLSICYRCKHDAI